MIISVKRKVCVAFGQGELFLIGRYFLISKANFLPRSRWFFQDRPTFLRSRWDFSLFWLTLLKDQGNFLRWGGAFNDQDFTQIFTFIDHVDSYTVGIFSWSRRTSSNGEAPFLNFSQSDPINFFAVTIFFCLLKDQPHPLFKAQTPPKNLKHTHFQKS